MNVQPSRRDRDDDEIRLLGCEHGNVLGVRRRVDDDEVDLAAAAPARDVERRMATLLSFTITLSSSRRSDQ
jgi:hypothetical protein